MRLGFEPSRRAVTLGVLGLLLVHFALAMLSARDKAMTHDEILHLTGGVSYWRFDDYRLHPSNGNLPQRWAALGVAWADFAFPGLDQESWRKSATLKIGDEFCHELGNDLDDMMWRGRIAIAILSTALCALVFWWSRATFGRTAGLLSLGLAALSPSLLAHGHWITSDTCAALFWGLAVWTLWRTLQHATLPRALASSVALGGLALSKMSAPLILPMAAGLVVVRLLRRRPFTLRLPGLGAIRCAGRGQQLLVFLGLAIAHAAVAITLIWAAYGFRYDAFTDLGPPGAEFTRLNRVKTERSIEGVAGELGTTGALLTWCADHELLPEAYLFGLGYVLAAQERVAFLNGEYSREGFASFFPYCLLVKTPLPLFGLLLAAMAAWFHGRRTSPARWRRITYHATPILALGSVYWIAALSTPLNIGHRHLLPTYGPMFVLAGGALYWWRSALGRLLVIGLTLAFAVESGRAFPHYQAYFNQITGRDDGYRHLVASSLDWGQDLIGLATYLEREAGDDPVYLAYFGTARPEYYGIEARYVPVTDWLPRDRDGWLMHDLTAGTYCISATALQSVNNEFPGPWNEEYERKMQKGIAKYRKRFPNGRPPQAFAKPQSLQRLDEYDQLRAARLMAYLRQREPDDRIGYTILIYRLTAEEAHAAIHGPPPELGEPL